MQPFNMSTDLLCALYPKKRRQIHWIGWKMISINTNTKMKRGVNTYPNNFLISNVYIKLKSAEQVFSKRFCKHNCKEYKYRNFRIIILLLSTQKIHFVCQAIVVRRSYARINRMLSLSLPARLCGSIFSCKFASYII